MLQLTVQVERLLAGKAADGSGQVVIEFGLYFGDEQPGIWKPLIGTHALFVRRQKGAPINLDPEVDRMTHG